MRANKKGVPSVAWRGRLCPIPFSREACLRRWRPGFMSVAWRNAAPVPSGRGAGFIELWWRFCACWSRLLHWIETLCPVSALCGRSGRVWINGS